MDAEMFDHLAYPAFVLLRPVTVLNRDVATDQLTAPVPEQAVLGSVGIQNDAILV